MHIKEKINATTSQCSHETLVAWNWEELGSIEGITSLT